MGLSNIEDILQAGLDGETLPTPESRIAELLKEWIEQGGNIDDILVAGSNITLTKNTDGTITISASGEVSSEDTVARADIAAIKDGETLDSFGDVETALVTKANVDNVYKLALTDADLLPVNTDLDNVKTVGCYYVYNQADASTIINRPVTNASAFRLTVDYGAGKSRPRQIYKAYNSYDTYVRNSDSSEVWSSWKKVEGDLSTKQDTISDLSTIRSGAALGATAVQPETGKGLSTNDYTDAEKTKLAGIEAQANKTTVDDALSDSSTNPIQNKVVKTALDGKANASTTYTKTEVDTALSGKQNAIDSSHKLSADLVDDTSTTNKFATAAELEQIETNKNNISKNAAELVELVDNGAKSLVDFPSINPIAVRSSYTTITDGYTITGNASAVYPYMALPFTNFKAGNYVLKITVSAFTGADASIYVKKGDYSTGTTIASQTITQTGDISVPFTLDTDSAEMGIAIYPNMKATETQQTTTVSKLMICTQAAWDVSQKYVPYRPTYEETVEQVAENENNISSLINYFEFFPLSEKTNTGAGIVVNQALRLQVGKYRFTATVSGTGSSQLKFTIGDSGETVDTKTWQNSTGTISEVYNLTSDTTWVTLYANAAVTYTNMSLKIEL